MRNTALLITLFIFCSQTLVSQVVLDTLDIFNAEYDTKNFFFTNRPFKKVKKDHIKFKNSFTKVSGVLYTGWYDIEDHNFSLQFKLTNTAGKKTIPEQTPQGNPFYTIYKELRIDNNIKHLVIFIPGFGKNFNQQTQYYMKNVSNKYANNTAGKVAFATYTWGTEDHFFLYYRGRRVSKRAAYDFAIFQNALDAFKADEAFFEDNPDDFEVHLITTSMASLMLNSYLKKRAESGIGFQKSYSSIGIFSSDNNWNSFAEGKGFDQLHKITDDIFVVINKKDILLTFSSLINFGNRLGLKGPKHEEVIDKYNIKLIDVSGYLIDKDYAKLGHDYLFQNPWMNDELVLYFQKISKD